MLVFLCCCCFASPVAAQLKSDKKQDKKEKSVKKKEAKKETTDSEDKKDDKPVADPPKEAKPATDVSKEEKLAEPNVEDNEKEDKNEPHEAPDPDDPTAKSVRVKVTFGPEYKNERTNTLINKVLKDSKGNIIIIKGSKGGTFQKDKAYISGYDANLKELYDDELDLGKMEGDHLYYHGAILLGGQGYIISDHYSNKKDKHEIYLFAIGEGGNIGNPQKVGEWDAEAEDEGNYELVLSRDKNKLLVFKTLHIRRNDTKLRVEFTVFDKDLQKIWAGKTAFVSEKKGGLFSSRRTGHLRNLMLDNSNRVFVLAETEREDNKNRDPDYITDLYQFVEGDNQPIKYNLDLSKKNIVGLSLIETSNPNELIGAGMYAENTKISWFSENEGSNGTFMFRLNLQSGEATSQSLHPFSNAIYDFMDYSAKERKKGMGIWGLTLVWAYLTPEENLVLSLEQNYKVITTGKYISYTTYYSKTMFNVKYGKDGALIYQNFIPKYALSGYETHGLSHILAPQGERHALIFNDHPKNTEKKLRTEKDLTGGRQSVARFVTMDEEGKRKASTLFSKKEGYLLPNAALHYAKGVMVSVVVTAKGFKLVRFDY
jgi:hypothetical protein